MAAIEQQASKRMVFLLSPQEKLKLQRQARRKRVSSAEIIRRSLAAYEPPSKEDEKLLSEMNLLIDQNLISIRKNLVEIRRSLDSIKGSDSQSAIK
jgi:uncharacterized protein YqiB (DUF1249 family)